MVIPAAVMTSSMAVSCQDQTTCSNIYESKTSRHIERSVSKLVGHWEGNICVTASCVIILQNMIYDEDLNWFRFDHQYRTHYPRYHKERAADHGVDYIVQSR